MGINMNGMDKDREVEYVEAEVVNEPTLNMKKPEQINMVEYQKSTKLALRKSPEVVALTNTIEVDNANTILTFGREASEGISKLSDNLLSTMKMVRDEEQGQMLVQLTKIMEKFDIEEFNNTKEPGFLEKIFNKAKSSIEAMLQKYETMGIEVQKIYQIVKGYEQDIYQSNKYLDQLFKANLDYYDELQKYICAGEIALEELDTVHLPKFKALADSAQNGMGDQKDIVNYQQLVQIRDILDQRVYDLRISENIAMQTVPMINGMRLVNYNLLRSVNTAFVQTLPTFKQYLAEAVIAKRMDLQAKSMQAFSDTANKVMVKHAENVSRQIVETTRMAGKSQIEMKTLETTWNIIMNGRQEVERIQEEQRKERLENTKALENMTLSIRSQQNLIK